jgi:hypothetical protein
MMPATNAIVYRTSLSPRDTIRTYMIGSPLLSQTFMPSSLICTGSCEAANEIV